jgi:hypothetical protein
MYIKLIEKFNILIKMFRNLKLKKLNQNLFRNNFKFFAEKKKVCVVDHPYHLNVYLFLLNLDLY